MKKLLVLSLFATLSCFSATYQEKREVIEEQRKQAKISVSYGIGGAKWLVGAAVLLRNRNIFLEGASVRGDDITFVRIYPKGSMVLSGIIGFVGFRKLKKAAFGAIDMYYDNQLRALPTAD